MGEPFTTNSTVAGPVRTGKPRDVGSRVEVGVTPESRGTSGVEGATGAEPVHPLNQRVSRVTRVRVNKRMFNPGNGKIAVSRLPIIEESAPT
jgi:hypothetical protein